MKRFFRSFALLFISLVGVGIFIAPAVADASIIRVYSFTKTQGQYAGDIFKFSLTGARLNRGQLKVWVANCEEVSGGLSIHNSRSATYTCRMQNSGYKDYSVKDKVDDTEFRSGRDNGYIYVQQKPAPQPKMSISSVQKNRTPKQGQYFSFSIYGSNFPSTIISYIDNCAGIQTTRHSSSYATGSCTFNQYATGSQLFLIKDRSGGTEYHREYINVQPDIAIYSVSPSTAKLNEQTTFTVSGKNLPGTMGFWIDQCSNPQPIYSPSLTTRQFTCTPQWSPGSKNGSVTAGSERLDFSIYVESPVLPPSVTGVSTNSFVFGKRSQFTITGTNFVNENTYWMAECDDDYVVSRNSSHLTISCIPRHSLKAKRIEFKEKSGGKIIKVLELKPILNQNEYSVSYDEAILEQETIFTVTGPYLPGVTKFWVDGCPGETDPIQELPGGTDTKRQFKCTPRWEAITRAGVIKDEHGNQIKAFAVDVSLPVDQDQIDDHYVYAQEISDFSKVQQGALSSLDDIDYYKFDLPNDQRVLIKGLSGANYQMTLFSAGQVAGGVIHEGQQYFPINNSLPDLYFGHRLPLIDANLRAIDGPFYLKIESTQNDKNLGYVASNQYRFAVSLESYSTGDVHPDWYDGSLSTLAINGHKVARINTESDWDFFSIPVSEPGVVTISTEMSPASIMLAFDSEGRPLATSEPMNVSSPYDRDMFQFNASTAGDYFLAVIGYTEESSYADILQERIINKLVGKGVDKLFPDSYEKWIANQVVNFGRQVFFGENVGIGPYVLQATLEVGAELPEEIGQLEEEVVDENVRVVTLGPEGSYAAQFQNFDTQTYYKLASSENGVVQVRLRGTITTAQAFEVDGSKLIPVSEEIGFPLHNGDYDVLAFSAEVGKEYYIRVYTIAAGAYQIDSYFIQGAYNPYDAHADVYTENLQVVRPVLIGGGEAYASVHAGQFVGKIDSLYDADVYRIKANSSGRLRIRANADFSTKVVGVLVDSSNIARDAGVVGNTRTDRIGTEFFEGLEYCIDNPSGEDLYLVLAGTFPEAVLDNVLFKAVGRAFPTAKKLIDVLKLALPAVLHTTSGYIGTGAYELTSEIDVNYDCGGSPVSSGEAVVTNSYDLTNRTSILIQDDFSQNTNQYKDQLNIRMYELHAKTDGEVRLKALSGGVKSLVGLFELTESGLWFIDSQKFPENLNDTSASIRYSLQQDKTYLLTVDEDNPWAPFSGSEYQLVANFYPGLVNEDLYAGTESGATNLQLSVDEGATFLIDALSDKFDQDAFKVCADSTQTIRYRLHANSVIYSHIYKQNSSVLEKGVMPVILDRTQQVPTTGGYVTNAVTLVAGECLIIRMQAVFPDSVEIFGEPVSALTRGLPTELILSGGAYLLEIWAELDESGTEPEPQPEPIEATYNRHSWATSSLDTMFASGVFVSPDFPSGINEFAYIKRRDFARWVYRAYAADQPTVCSSQRGRPFSDVYITDKDCAYIQALKDWGVVNGVAGGNTFAPNDLLNRAEAVKMIRKTMFGVDSSASGACFGPLSNWFPDVPMDAWYCDDVYQLNQKGIVKGYDTGRFEPTHNLTLRQIAAFLNRSMGRSDLIIRFDNQGRTIKVRPKKSLTTISALPEIPDFKGVNTGELPVVSLSLENISNQTATIKAEISDTDGDTIYSEVILADQLSLLPIVQLQSFSLDRYYKIDLSAYEQDQFDFQVVVADSVGNLVMSGILVDTNSGEVIETPTPPEPTPTPGTGFGDGGDTGGSNNSGGGSSHPGTGIPSDEVSDRLVHRNYGRDFVDTDRRLPTLLTQNQAVTKYINEIGDQDAFQFYPDPSALYQLDLSSDIDLKVELFTTCSEDEEPDFVWQTVSKSLKEVFALNKRTQADYPAHPYCFRVQAVDGSAVGAYNLKYALAETVPVGDDYPDTQEQAAPGVIRTGNQHLGKMHLEGDKDVFVFTPEQTRYYQITVSGAEMRLLDQEGAVVSGSELRLELVTGKQYFVEVTGVIGANYALKFEPSLPPSTPSEVSGAYDISQAEGLLFTHGVSHNQHPSLFYGSSDVFILQPNQARIFRLGAADSQTYYYDVRNLLGTGQLAVQVLDKDGNILQRLSPNGLNQKNIDLLHRVYPDTVFYLRVEETAGVELTGNIYYTSVKDDYPALPSGIGISLGEVISGSISDSAIQGEDVDAFRFFVEEPGQYKFEMVQERGIHAFVLNQQQEQLHADSSYNQSFILDLQAGQFYYFVLKGNYPQLTANGGYQFVIQQVEHADLLLDFTGISPQIIYAMASGNQSDQVVDIPVISGSGIPYFEVEDCTGMQTQNADPGFVRFSCQPQSAGQKVVRVYADEAKTVLLQEATLSVKVRYDIARIEQIQLNTDYSVLLNAGSNSAFTHTSNRNGLYRLSLANIDQGDLRVEVYRDGNFVQAFDETIVSMNDHREFDIVLWLASDYEFHIRSINTNLLDLRLDLVQELAHDDAGNTFAEATPLPEFGHFGTIEEVGDIDVWKFEVEQAGVYQIGTTGVPVGGIPVSTGILYAADGSVIDEADGSVQDHQGHYVLFADLVPGVEYAVSVEYLAQATGQYRLTIIPPSFTSETDDYANDVLNASPVANGVVVNGYIEAQNDIDYFKMEIPDDAEYAFSSNLQGLTMIDSVGRVFVLQSGLNVIRGGQTVYFKVEGNITYPQLSYTFLITRDERSVDDHGDTIDEATNIEEDQSIASHLGRPGDRDFFSFTPTETKTYLFRTERGSKLEATLYNPAKLPMLYDRYIDGDVTGRENNIFLASQSVLQAGQTYYLEIYAAETDHVTDYTLFVSEGDDYPSDATTQVYLQKDILKTGALQFNTDIDFFKIQVPGTGNYRFTVNSDFDRQFSVHHLNTSLVGTTIENAGTEEVLEYQLSAGEYLISMRSRSQAFRGTYSILFEIPVQNYFSQAEELDYDAGVQEVTGLQTGRKSYVQNAPGGNNYFILRPDYPAKYKFTATSQTVESKIEVYTSAGVLLGEYTSAIADTNGLELPLQPGVVYYVRLTRINHIGAGVAYVDFGMNELPVVQYNPFDDYGNTFETAQSVLTTYTAGPYYNRDGQVKFGSIEKLGDIDVFTFEVQKPGDYYFYSQDASTQMIGSLYQSTNLNAPYTFSRTFYVNGNPDGKNFQIGIPGLQAGTYYLEVKPVHAKVTATYQLYFESRVNNYDDYGDDLAHSEIYTVGTAISGVGEIPGDVDLFRFTPTESGLYQFSKTGSQDHTELLLSRNDAGGYLLEENRLISIMSPGDQSKTVNLEAGRQYVLGIYTNNPGDYEMSLEFLSPPPGPPPTPTFTSINTETVTIGETVEFIIRGENFPNQLQIEYSGCDTLGPIVTSASEIRFTCDIHNTPGVSQLSVKDQAGALLQGYTISIQDIVIDPEDPEPIPLPVISTLNVDTVTDGVEQEFVLTGANIPQDIVIAYDACDDLGQITITHTQVSFTCLISGTWVQPQRGHGFFSPSTLTVSYQESLLKEFQVVVAEMVFTTDPVPVVGEINITSAEINSNQQFTISGEHLELGLDVEYDGCQDLGIVGKTTTALQFSCRVKNDPGETTVIVKNDGGAVIKEFTVMLTAPAGEKLATYRFIPSTLIVGEEYFQLNVTTEHAPVVRLEVDSDGDGIFEQNTGVAPNHGAQFPTVIVGEQTQIRIKNAPEDTVIFDSGYQKIFADGEYYDIYAEVTPAPEEEPASIPFSLTVADFDTSVDPTMTWHYTFDGSLGHGATPVGSMQYATGIARKALVLNGGNGVNTQNAFDYPSFTVAMYALPDFSAISSELVTLYEQDNFRMQLRNGHLECEINTSTGLVTIQSFSTITGPNEHIACSVDSGQSLNLFVGQHMEITKDLTTLGSHLPTVPGISSTIGYSFGNPGQGYIGKIDQLRIWNRAVPVGEIYYLVNGQHFNNGNPYPVNAGQVYTGEAIKNSFGYQYDVLVQADGEYVFEVLGQNPILVEKLAGSCGGEAFVNNPHDSSFQDTMVLARHERCAFHIRFEDPEVVGEYAFRVTLNTPSNE